MNKKLNVISMIFGVFYAILISVLAKLHIYINPAKYTSLLDMIPFVILLIVLNIYVNRKGNILQIIINGILSFVIGWGAFYLLLAFIYLFFF